MLVFYVVMCMFVYIVRFETLIIVWRILASKLSTYGTILDYLKVSVF